MEVLTVPAAVDDGTSSAIPIPTGFPTGGSNQSTAYASTNVYNVMLWWLSSQAIFKISI